MTQLSKRVWLVLFALLFAAVLLEFAARLFSWSIGKGFWTRPNSFTSAFFVTYDWPPPLIQGSKGTFRRGEIIDMQKPPNELRVICLGGSATADQYNKEGLAWSLETEKLLRGRLDGYSVRVLNAGGDAFSTAHLLVNFSLRLLAFRPDMIVVYENINDLTALYDPPVLPDYSNKYLRDVFLAYEHRQGLRGVALRLSRGLQLVKWKSAVVYRMLEGRSASHVATTAELEEGRKLFRRNLESLVAVAKHHDVEAILITQARRDGEAGNFRSYNNEVRACGLKNGARTLDASEAMSGRKALFEDAIHLSAEGSRALASLLAPVVEEELKEFVKRRSSGGR